MFQMSNNKNRDENKKSNSQTSNNDPRVVKVPRETNVALVTLTTILMVLLLGAVIVMGSLIYQFANGKNSFGSDVVLPDGFSTLIISEGPISAEGGEDIVYTSEVARGVMPSLAKIEIYTRTDLKLVETMVGVVMSEDGYIITSYDVAGGDYILCVVLDNKQYHDPEIVGTDKTTGITVLHIDATNLRAADFANSNSIVAGEQVVAFGSIESSDIVVGEGIVGIVSGFATEDNRISDRYQSYIVVDAALASQYNNSVVVNKLGQVIGLSGIGIAGDTGASAQFLIPINDIKPVVDNLIEYGYVLERATLGLTTTTVSAAAGSESDSPAGARVDLNLRKDAAEIAEGSIITAVNGTPISSTAQLIAAIRNRPPFTGVTLTLYDPVSADTFDVTVELFEDTGR